MKKKIILATTILTFLLVFGSQDVFAKEESTMRSLEKEVINYVDGSNITPGTAEYSGYLNNQLMFQQNVQLTQADNYDEIVLYMSSYLNNQTLPQSDFYQTSVADQRLRLERDNLSTRCGKKPSNTPRKVNRKKVVAYANKWWNKRNPNYQIWDPNNCVNYVSQVIEYAGVDKVSPEIIPDINIVSGNYWYSEKLINKNNPFSQSVSWINVNEFYRFWAKTQTTVGPMGVSIKEYGQVGDVIELQSTAGGDWYHAMIVVAKDKDTIYLSGNTNDREKMDIRDISNTNFRMVKFN